MRSIAELESDSMQMEWMQPTQLIQPRLTSSEWAAKQNLWGYLEPLDPGMPFILFHKSKWSYSIGRSVRWQNRQNDYLLTDPRISNEHCTIAWNGREDLGYCVLARDESSNGTFLNGIRIAPTGPDMSRRESIIRDGDIISFASPTPPDGKDPGHCDNRFVYRHTANSMVVSQVFR